jgi:hypothetical protein
LDYFFITKQRSTEQDLKYLKTAHNLEERKSRGEKSIQVKEEVI